MLVRSGTTLQKGGGTESCQGNWGFNKYFDDEMGAHEHPVTLSYSPIGSRVFGGCASSRKRNAFRRMRTKF